MPCFIFPTNFLVQNTCEGYFFYLLEKKHFPSTQNFASVTLNFIRNPSPSYIDWNASIELYYREKVYHLLTIPSHLPHQFRSWDAIPMLANFLRQCTSNWMAFVETDSHNGDEMTGFIEITFGFWWISAASRSRYFAVHERTFTVQHLVLFASIS